MSNMHASFCCKHTSIRTHVQVWQFDRWLHSQTYLRSSAGILQNVANPHRNGSGLHQRGWQWPTQISIPWFEIIISIRRTVQSHQQCTTLPIQAKTVHYLTQAQTCRVFFCFYLCHIVPHNMARWPAYACGTCPIAAMWLPRTADFYLHIFCLFLLQALLDQSKTSTKQKTKTPSVTQHMISGDNNSLSRNVGVMK